MTACSKDGPGSNQNVSLVYTNSDEHSHSEEVAKFTVPKLTKKWSKIVIKVSATDVTFYLNCHEMARQRVTRIPQKLVFDTASTLYIAQAGPHIQERYDVSTATLRLSARRFGASERQKKKEKRKQKKSREKWKKAEEGERLDAPRAFVRGATRQNETKRAALVACGTLSAESSVQRIASHSLILRMRMRGSESE